MAIGIVRAMDQHVCSFALAVIAGVTRCWLLNVTGTARLAGIAATILLLMPHQGAVERMMLSRDAEVGRGRVGGDRRHVGI